ALVLGQTYPCVRLVRLPRLPICRRSQACRGATAALRTLLAADERGPVPRSHRSGSSGHIGTLNASQNARQLDAPRAVWCGCLCMLRHARDGGASQLLLTAGFPFYLMSLPAP